MAKLYASYVREMYKQTGYMAIWPPDAHIELGMVLKEEGNQCICYSELASFGIDFEEAKDPTPANWEYQSEGGVAITFKASGAWVNDWRTFVLTCSWA